MRQKMTFRRVYRQPKWLLTIALLLCACQKKEIYQVQQKPDQAKYNNTDKNSQKEIFSPMPSRAMWFEKFQPGDDYAIFLREYYKKYYKPGEYGLDGELLSVIKGKYEGKEISHYGNYKGPMYGQFFKEEVDFAIKEEYLLQNSNNSDLAEYIISEGKNTEHRYETGLDSLKKISPSSVIDVRIGLLSPDFKPFCFVELIKKKDKSPISLKLSKGNLYNVYARNIIMLTKNDVKIALTEIILKSYNGNEKISDKEQQIRTSVEEVFINYDHQNEIPMLQCISIYSDISERMFIEEILTSVFPNNVNFFLRGIHSD